MPDVIVAGAGPTGLWLAGELALGGVEVLVIEKNAERDRNSRALTVHPRTLELLSSRGIAERFVGEGIPIPAAHFGALDSRLDFSTLDTPFPYTLALEQVRTEELLEEWVLSLGVTIRKGESVIGFEEIDTGVRVSVEGSQGRRQEEASYVVGCEGVRSAVRSSAGIVFEGADSNMYGAMADLELAEKPGAGMALRHGAKGLLLVAPLPSGLFRIVIVDPEITAGEVRKLDFEGFRDRVIRIAGTDFTMRRAVWISTFSNETRLADSYRAGRSFVAGDAAHMHFPAGGVGLNVGVQDAMNLGWKLAAHIKGLAAEHLLDTYDEERRPVGSAVLESSLAQTSLITGFSWQGRSMRSLLSHYIGTIPELNKALAERVSAIDVRYGDDEDPLVGRRAPDLQTAGNASSSLFELLHEGKFVLIGTADECAGVAADDWLRVVRAQVKHPHEDWKDVTSLLVRPDGHIAWVGRSGSEDTALIEAVTKWVRPTPVNA